MHKFVLRTSNLWGLIGLLCLCLPLLGQEELTPDGYLEDQLSNRYTQQGLYFLEIGNLSVAQEAFRRASQRPLNLQSSLATYLAGVSFFKAEMYDSAQTYFRKMMVDFPQSPYTEEAKYHLGLLWLKHAQPRIRTKGLIALTHVADSAAPPLQEDIHQQVMQFLFKCEDISWMEQMTERLPTAYQSWLLEPLCYHYVQSEHIEEAEALYQEFQEKHSLYSPFVEKMLASPLHIQYVPKDLVKIALVLPFQLTSPPLNTPLSIPKESRIPLEYFEGLKLGLETYTLHSETRFEVSVLDSRRQEEALTKLLPRLDSISPHVIIGDLYNTQSRQLSEWAEQHATPQIVPLSPAASLTQNRPYTLLAHPPAYLHGAEMAKFARQALGLDRVAVWDDGQSSSNTLARSFQIQFELLGGEVIYVAIDSAFNTKSRKEIVKLSKVLANRPLDGMYIPLQNNEESAGLILSQMRVLRPEWVYLGGPHFGSRYNTIANDIKADLGLYFSTNYDSPASSAEAAALDSKYLQQFGFPPSQYVIQGYDLGIMLANMLDQYDYKAGVPLIDFLRNAPRKHGIHHDLDFRGRQINQAVNLVQFSPEGKKRLNRFVDLNLQALLSQQKD